MDVYNGVARLPGLGRKFSEDFSEERGSRLCEDCSP